jgi:D-sedoheptulose 7-phosphate isomerase
MTQPFDPKKIAETALLDGLTARKETLESKINDIVEIGLLCAKAIENGNKLLLCGNGGSAADAQHLAAELLIRLRPDVTRQTLPAIALAMDSSTLTACGNDLGYDQLFARMVEALGNPDDVLIGITTSGKSKNVNLAFEKAKDKGIHTVGFLGGSGGASLKLCDLSFVAPSDITGRIQELHISAGHIVMEIVEDYLLNKSLISLVK